MSNLTREQRFIHRFDHARDEAPLTEVEAREDLAALGIDAEAELASLLARLSSEPGPAPVHVYPTYRRPHDVEERGATCWCTPTIQHVDPRTGAPLVAPLIVHHEGTDERPRR